MASRLNGEKLIAGSDERWPMMVFFEDCKYCQDYIPMLERHPNDGRLWDAQEDGEATHICDCCRLAAMANKIIVDAPTKIDEDYLNSEIKKVVGRKKTVRDLIPDLSL
jgi:hypothetical protein